MSLFQRTVPGTRGHTDQRRHAGRVVDIVAVAAASAFAGGALLSQTVIAPGWQAMDPDAFLNHFARYGPATGLTVFPFEAASMVLLVRAAYTALTRRRQGRLAWVLAAVCMAGTFLLLIYFVPANLALLDPAFPPASVPAALDAWYRWNWIRAGLGVAAAVFGCGAMTASCRTEQQS